MTAAGPGLELFYPIVPDADWLARLVPQGVRTIQLRIKEQPSDVVRRQIDRSLELCRRHRCQLIVNDYWREAIAAGADYIHLGQEDLAAGDMAAIRRAGLRFGLSSHSHDELAVAIAAKPDYIALGPIYETKLKAMRWAPQGLDRIGEWAAAIAPIPLVAIGGITLERAPGVRAAGAKSVAVVTDVLGSANPEARARKWLAWARTAA